MPLARSMFAHMGREQPRRPQCRAVEDALVIAGGEIERRLKQFAVTIGSLDLEARALGDEVITPRARLRLLQQRHDLGQHGVEQMLAQRRFVVLVAATQFEIGGVGLQRVIAADSDLPLPLISLPRTTASALSLACSNDMTVALLAGSWSSASAKLLPGVSHLRAPCAGATTVAKRNAGRDGDVIRIVALRAQGKLQALGAVLQMLACALRDDAAMAAWSLVRRSD